MVTLMELLVQPEYTASSENIQGDANGAVPLFMLEQLEPRVMLAADMAALGALVESTYLSDLDTYLDNNVFNKNLMLINDNLLGVEQVDDFVFNISEAFRNFSLSGDDLTIDGFITEVNSLFSSGSNNYGLSIAVSGNEYSDTLSFQLDFSYDFTTTMDANFNINEDEFKLITMISNLQDGSSVTDMVSVDIDMDLSYCFSISEALPATGQDTFYIDQEGGNNAPNSLDGQYTIKDKNGMLLYKQKVESGALVTDGSGNAIYTGADGIGTYNIIDGKIQNADTGKYLAIDSDCAVTEVADATSATVTREFDTVFSILPRQADSSGNNGVFSLDYRAVLNDNFSAIGQIGGMTALIYEKDNTRYSATVGSDENLTVHDNPISSLTQLVDYIKHNRPADKSQSDLMFDFFNDRDVTSESYSAGRIVTSITGADLAKYSITYNSVSQTLSTEVGLSDTEFAANIASTELYNQDMDIYLYAKMSLVPDMAAWTDLNLSSDWFTSNVDSSAIIPELDMETPIFIYAGETANTIAAIDGDTDPVAGSIDFTDAAASQDYTVLFSPTVLDVGAFWENTIGAFLGQLGEIFDPIMPAVELLLNPMPGLSDLTEMVGLGELSTMDFMQNIANIYAIKDKGVSSASVRVLTAALNLVYLLNQGKMPADMAPEEIPGDLSMGAYTFKKKLYETPKDGESSDSSKKSLSKSKIDATDTKDEDKAKSTGDKAKNKTKETSVEAQASYEFSFDTPLFTSPEDFVFGLMSGDTSAALFSMNLKASVGIDMSVTFPFLSIGIAQLAAVINPSFKMGFDVGVGFDLYGMNNFLARLEWDSAQGKTLEDLRASAVASAEDIFTDGFYFDNHYDAEKDEDNPEFYIDLGIALGLEASTPDLGPINIAIGVVGGLTFKFSININDMPNKLPYYQWRNESVYDVDYPGGTFYKYDLDTTKWIYDNHTHLDELKEMRTAKNIFSLGVAADFSASLYLDISLDLGFFEITLIKWNLELFSITLFEASLSSPASSYDIIVHTGFDEPVLAGWKNLDAMNNGVLTLYMGDESVNRNYSNEDGTAKDNLTDESYIIKSLGYTQILKNADGSNKLDTEGNIIYTYGEQDQGLGETVDISFNGNTQRVHKVKEILGDGGDGNDKIQFRGSSSFESSIKVKFSGGAGDDILSYTGLGAARLFGDAGQDTLVGGEGADYLDGGVGNDKLYGRGGMDMLVGYDGNDYLNGGKGVDTLDGGNGGYELVNGVDGEYKGDDYYWVYGDGEDIVNDTGVNSSDTGGNTLEDKDVFVIGGSQTRVGENTIQKPDTVDITQDDSGKFVVNLQQSWSAELPTATMLKMDGIENIVLGAGGGGDVVNVYDFSATDVKELDLGLNYSSISPGGAQLNIYGTAANDTIGAKTNTNIVSGVAVSSFNITRKSGNNDQLIVGITSSDASSDFLNIYGGDGDDTINVTSTGDASVSDYMSLGKIDGGAGNDTITIDGVTGIADKKFEIAGAGGNDNITVRNSSNFVIVGEDSKDTPTTFSDDSVLVDNSRDFSVYAGDGTNELTLNSDERFELYAGAGKDTLTTTNIADFTIDLGDGDSPIVFHGSAVRGTIIAGTGQTTIVSDTPADVTVRNLQLLNITLGGGATVGKHDIVNISAADGIVLNTSDDNDEIILNWVNDITLNSGGGVDSISVTDAKEVQVDAGADDDMITLSELAAGSGVVVHAGDGADTITAQNAEDYKIYGEAGNDNITVDYGTALLSGGAGEDTLTITDSADGSGRSATVALQLVNDLLTVTDATKISQTNFSDFDLLNLNLGGALNTAAVANALLVQGLGQKVMVKGSGAADNVTVLTEPDYDFAFDGEEGIDRLTVTFQVISDNATLADGTITGAGSGTINFSDVESTVINLGDASDTFIVNSTSNDTSIYAGGGDDMVIVDNAAHALNVYGGSSGDANQAGTGDTDRLVLRLSDGVPLAANTFNNVGLTTEIVEIRNTASNTRSFTIADQKIYADAAKTLPLLDLSAALGTGLLEQIVLTGNSNDSLTIDDTALTEALGVEADNNTISYGKGYYLVLEVDTLKSDSTLDAQLYRGFTMDFDGVKYFYYQDSASNSNIWAYSRVSRNADGTYTAASRQELIDSKALAYTASNGAAETITLYDTDMDGLYEIDSAEKMYALMRCTDVSIMNMNFELKSDINLSGYTLATGIGGLCDSAYSYSGHFNGNGYKISGLSLTAAESADRVGLFNKLSGTAIVENFELSGASVTGLSNGYSGFVAGEISEGTIIVRNVTVSGNSTINGGGFIGGIAGLVKLADSEELQITDCLIKDVTCTSASLFAGIIADVLLEDTGKATIDHCWVENVDCSPSNTKSAGFVYGINKIGSAAATPSMIIKNSHIKNSKVTSGVFYYFKSEVRGDFIGDNILIEGLDGEHGVFEEVKATNSNFTLNNILVSSSTFVNGLGETFTNSGKTTTISNITVDATQNSGSFYVGLIENTTIGDQAKMVISGVKVLVGNSSTSASAGLLRNVMVKGVNGSNGLDLDIHDVYISGYLKDGSGMIGLLRAESYAKIKITNCQVDIQEVRYGLMKTLEQAKGSEFTLSGITVKGTVGSCGGIYDISLNNASFKVDNIIIDTDEKSGYTGMLVGLANRFNTSSSSTVDIKYVSISLSSLSSSSSDVIRYGLINELKLSKTVCKISLCNILVDSSDGKGEGSAVLGSYWSAKEGSSLYFHSSFVRGYATYALSTDLKTNAGTTGPASWSCMYFYNLSIRVHGVVTAGNTEGTVWACDTLYSTDATINQGTNFGTVFTHLDYHLYKADGSEQSLYKWWVYDQSRSSTSGRILSVNIDLSDQAMRDLYSGAIGHYDVLTNHDFSYALPDMVQGTDHFLIEGDPGFVDLEYPDVCMGASGRKIIQTDTGGRVDCCPIDLSAFGYNGSAVGNQYGAIAGSDTSDKINPAMTGSLTFLTAATTTAGNTYIYGTTASGNGIAWYKRNSDGLLDKYSVQTLLLDTGYKLESLAVDSSGKYLVATAKNTTSGNREVYAYKITQASDTTDGSLSKLSGGSISSEEIISRVNTGNSVYLGTADGKIVRASGNDSAWSLSANLVDTGAEELGEVTSLKLSEDGNYLYSVHNSSDTIAIYKINSANGSLTLVSRIKDGVNRVKGLDGVSDVVEKNGYLIACANASDTLAVFKINTERTSFEQMQYLRNGSGISSMVNPLAMEETADGIRILSYGATGSSVNELSIDSNPVEPHELWNLEYSSGIDTLNFMMGSGDDDIILSGISASNININSGAGSDYITIDSTLPASVYSIDTGADNDSVIIRSADADTDFTINTGTGEDNVSATSIGGNSTITTAGGDDTVEIGTVLSAADLTVDTGTGSDTITVDKVEAGGDAVQKTEVNIEGGAGNDTFESQIAGANTITTFVGGSGDDTVALSSGGISTDAAFKLYGDIESGPNNANGVDTLVYYGNPSNTLSTTNGIIEKSGVKIADYYTFDNLSTPAAKLLAAIIIINNTNPGAPIKEGDRVTFSAASSSIPVSTGLRYYWDFNNDGVYDHSALVPDVTLDWNDLKSYGISDDGVYTVKLLVTANGESSSAEIALKVENTKRLIAISGADSKQEDTAYSLTLNRGSSSEPGADSINKWVVDWGDGTVLTYYENDLIYASGADTTTVNHTYKTPAAYTITVSAYDEDASLSGTSDATKNITITADTRAHITVGNSAGETVDEGSLYTLSLKSDRPQSGAGVWTVNWGDGTSSVVSSSNTLNLSSLTHTYADGSAAGTDYNIVVKLVDQEGSFSATHEVTVMDVAPALTLTGDSTGSEGTAYSLTISPADPGSDTISKYKIDWGDGIIQDFSNEFPGQDFVATHVYADGSIAGDSYTISVSAIDEDGQYNNVAAKSVVINNVAPTVSFDQEGQTLSAVAGASISISGISYSDPGSDPVTGWSVDWGDGIIDNYTMAQLLALNNALSHIYRDKGDYNMSVSAWDGVDYTSAAPVSSGTCSIAVTAGSTGDNSVDPDDPITTIPWVKPVIELSDSVTSVGENKIYALTLSNYKYDFQNDKSIDAVIVNWGDGKAETLSSSDFLTLKQGENMVLYHLYADGDGSACDISVTFKDNEITKGALQSDTMITEGTPASDSGVVLKDGVPYYNEDKAVVGYNIVISPGLVTDVDGNKSYLEIVRDSSGNYHLRTYDVSESTTSYDNDNILQIIIDDVPPHFELTGSDTATQGKEYSLNIGSVIDVADDTLTTYVIDWGDGSSDIINDANVSAGRTLTHIYTTEGDKQISISQATSDGTTYDNTGNQLSTPLTVTVVDAPMDIVISGSGEVGEQQLYTLTLGKITDPANPTATVIPSKWIVNWGDGSQQIIDNSSMQLPTTTVSHKYTGPKDFVYNASVSFIADSSEYTGSKLHTVKVVNLPPVITQDSASTNIDEGSSFTGSYTITDSGFDSKWTVTVDYGDGSEEDSFEVNTTEFNLTHVYDDDGTYTMKFKVTDERGAVSEEFSAVNDVINVAPTITISGSDTVAEGSEYTLTIGAVTDPGDDTVQEYRIDWGNGESDIISRADIESVGNTLTHTYVNNGDYTIKLSLSDEDGNYNDIASKGVTVSNVAPVAAITGIDTVAEGSEYALTIGAVTDPGGDTVNEYRIDWGDGKSDIVSSADLSSAGRILKHNYEKNGEYTVRLSLTDDDGSYSNVASKTVAVSNVAPVAAISGNDTLTEGSEYVLTVGAVTDPGGNTVNEYRIDWGDGKTDIVSSADLLSAGRVLKHIYADSGDYVAKLSLSDNDGSYSNVSSKAVTVNNVAPVVNITGSATVAEGRAYTLTIGNISDPGDDTVSEYRIDWGDGQSTILTAEELPADRKVTHVYADDMNPEIKLVLLDEDGVYSGYTPVDVSVTNVNPELRVQTLGGVIQQSVDFDMVVNLIDVACDKLDVYIDFGDGQGVQKASVGLLRSTLFSKSYSTPGEYTISLYVMDDDGGVSSTFAFDVTVNSIPASQNLGKISAEDENETVADNQLPKDTGMISGDNLSLLGDIKYVNRIPGLTNVWQNNEIGTPVGGVGSPVVLSRLNSSSFASADSSSLADRMRMLDISSFIVDISGRPQPTYYSMIDRSMFSSGNTGRSSRSPDSLNVKNDLDSGDNIEQMYTAEHNSQDIISTDIFLQRMSVIIAAQQKLSPDLPIQNQSIQGNKKILRDNNDASAGTDSSTGGQKSGENNGNKYQAG